ncbi:hypothetical protein [Yoonia sp. 208BN28-4]
MTKKNSVYGVTAKPPRLTVLALFIIASAVSVPVWIVLTLAF